MLPNIVEDNNNKYNITTNKQRCMQQLLLRENTFFEGIPNKRTLNRHWVHRDRSKMKCVSFIAKH